MQTKPKKFKNGEQLVQLFEDFCSEIKLNEFSTVPTQTNFCTWLRANYQECDRKTIYNALNKYFPTIKKDFERIQSDTIVEGTMLNHYQPSMSIFALKNWCKWKDNPTDEEKQDNKLEIKIIRE